MNCKHLWDIQSQSQCNMQYVKVKAFIFLLQVFMYTIAVGIEGASGNQWNQGQQPARPQTKGPIGGWDDEVSNPIGDFPDQGSMWKLEDSIPGVPGQSYPNFGKLPDSSFDCRKQIGPGYYADVESKCQVFHICQTDGRHNSFLCPTGTIFNQQTFTCDWWFNVNCGEASMFYVRNGNLYKGPHIGIDGEKVSSYGDQRRTEPTGNKQQPAVGIPNADSNAKGPAWPSQRQDPSQGNWGANQRGNQKGGNRPARGMMGRNQNWNSGGQSSKGQGNANVGQRNGQKGFQSNQQQAGLDNQRWNVQGSRDTANQGWSQNGGGAPNAQSQQRGMKGGSPNQRQFNARGGFQAMNGDPGRFDGRRGAEGRMNTNKGFDTNTWSIRARNFQSSSQDRKGSSSDIWPNNQLAAPGGPDGMNPHHQNRWQDQSGDFRNSAVSEEYFENRDQNQNWNNEDGNSYQWDENVAKGSSQRQWARSLDNDYDYY